MNAMSLQPYYALTDGIELALDEADRIASISENRYSGEEVFNRVKNNLHGQEVE